MIDSPARQGFYEGIYESYRQGHSATAISSAIGLSVTKVHDIIATERSRRHQSCCVCHQPATTYLRGMIDDTELAEDGLFSCDNHEEFLTRGIVWGNGYAGLHIEVLKSEGRQELTA